MIDNNFFRPMASFFSRSQQPQEESEAQPHAHHQAHASQVRGVGHCDSQSLLDAQEPAQDGQQPDNADAKTTFGAGLMAMLQFMLESAQQRMPHGLFGGPAGAGSPSTGMPEINGAGSPFGAPSAEPPAGGFGNGAPHDLSFINNQPLQRSAAPDTPAASPDGGGQPSSTAAGRPDAAGPTSATGAAPTAGKPDNAIDAKKEFGLVGDGKTDDGPALQRALDAGKASGRPVYLSEGNYKHDDTLKLDGVKLNGDGEKTVLKATNPDKSAVTLTGDDASLSNVKTQIDNAPQRSSQPDAAAVLVQNASNAKVSNVSVQGAASNGIRLDNAQDSTISNNLVQGTNADGIALMNGSSNNMVSKNVVHQAGDDAFSDDSYTSDAKQNTNNSFDSNMALDNKYGRGFALMGSKDSKVTNNIVNGTPGQGVMAGTDANSATMQGSGAQISGNKVQNEFNAPQGQNATLETPAAVKNDMGSLPSIADITGWKPTLVDRSEINSVYVPGTGKGANNKDGNRE